MSGESKPRRQWGKPPPRQPVATSSTSSMTATGKVHRLGTSTKAGAAKLRHIDNKPSGTSSSTRISATDATEGYEPSPNIRPVRKEEVAMPEPPFPHDAPLSDLSESASAAATGGDHYDDLLYKLEAKNRMQKEVESQSPDKVELLQKEQGFSLYVNGPHSKSSKNVHRVGRQPVVRGRERNRGVRRAAGGSQEKRIRATTAPGKQRKVWQPHGHSLKQRDGTSVPVTAPGKVTGVYDDDFESDDSSCSSGSEKSDDAHDATGFDGDKTLTEFPSLFKGKARDSDQSDLSDSLELNHLQSSGSLTDVISDHCQSLESSFNTSFTGVKSPAGGSGAPLATDMSRKSKAVISSVSVRSDTSQDKRDNDDQAALVMAAIQAENRRLDDQDTSEISITATSAARKDSYSPQASARGRPPHSATSLISEILGIPEPKKPTIASTSVFDDEEPSRARPISGRRAELRSTSSFPMVTDVCDVGAVLALRSQSCSGLPGSRSASSMHSFKGSAPERAQTAVLQRGMSQLLRDHCRSDPTLIDKIVISQTDPLRSQSASRLLTSTPDPARRSVSAVSLPDASVASSAGLFGEERPVSRITTANSRDRHKSIQELCQATPVQIGTKPDELPHQTIYIPIDPDEVNIPLSSDRPAGLAQASSRASSARDRSKKSVQEVMDADSDPRDNPLYASSTSESETETSQERIAKVAMLEESLQSLRRFDETKRGRIETEVSLNAPDDLLDIFLEEEKTRREMEVKREAGEPTDAEETCTPFPIPELPRGGMLEVAIFTTWGDKHYVGLNGIEVFGVNGSHVEIASIYSIPTDINSLPGYSSDPRVVTNLLDGVNLTRDDFHMWLAPFTKGVRHSVYLEFAEETTVAMIRIWNYNKSRVHSYRGARHVEITLDGISIFQGTVKRASGAASGPWETFAENILYTLDKAILTEVAKNDYWYVHDCVQQQRCLGHEPDRPGTAHKEAEKSVDDADIERITGTDRPETRVGMMKTKLSTAASKRSKWNSQIKPIRGRNLGLKFTENYGDRDFIGLSGIEVLGSGGKTLQIDPSQLEGEPRDITVLAGSENDTRRLENLVNGCNSVVDDNQMWLAPLETKEAPNRMMFFFEEETCITGLRFYNYNKSQEDTRRGVREIHVFLDGEPLEPEYKFLLRRAPGHASYDFGQTILFGPQPIGFSSSLHSDQPVCYPASNAEEPDSLPTGFLVRLHLRTSCGDPWYIGLNGIELYNEHYQLLSPHIVGAYPESCNSLPDVCNDCRTPDKLVNGVYDTYDGKEMWLAPLVQDVLLTNQVDLVFEEPVSISVVKLWNYAKTPSRGVRNFSILMDGSVIYTGKLEKADSQSSGILPTCAPPVSYQSVVFTKNPDIVRAEQDHIIKAEVLPADIRMTDYDSIENKSKRRGSDEYRRRGSDKRPTTSVPAASTGGSLRMAHRR